jgi:hypothetical protein
MDTNPTDVQSLAILSVRLCLFVDPYSSLASELMASHMADIVAISNDREQVIISYPSEPILAEAAANYATKFRLELIEKMVSLIHSGMVTNGYRGELLGRYLLLDSWERASMGREVTLAGNQVCFSVPMKVRDFLNSFSPKIIKAMSGQINNADMEKFLNGIICFNQFLRIQFSLTTMDQLQAYLERCAAILLKENEKAFDIVVPVYIPGEGMTAIMYQTRNYTGNDKNLATADKQQRFTNFTFEGQPKLPYLALYSQFGDESGPGRVISLKKERRTMSRIAGREKTPEEKYQMIVGLIGLSGSVYQTCLYQNPQTHGTGDDESMMANLRSLRDARLNHRAFVKSKKFEDIIKSNFVLTYDLESRMERQHSPNPVHQEEVAGQRPRSKKRKRK